MRLTSLLPYLKDPRNTWTLTDRLVRTIFGRQIIADRPNANLNLRFWHDWEHTADQRPNELFDHIKQHKRHVLDNHAEAIRHDSISSKKATDMAAGQCCGLISLPDKDGRMLYDFIRNFELKQCLEFGGAFGVGTRYIATALRDNAQFANDDLTAYGVTSIELWQWRREIAVERLAALEPLVNATVGEIEDVFPTIVAQRNNFDFAFVDALHTFEATVGYFNLINDNIPGQIFCIFHDIRNSWQTLRAWKTIISTDRVIGAIHTNSIGVVELAPA